MTQSNQNPQPPTSQGEKGGWEKDWLEYCRNYLTRHGITDEVDILSIAGNLEQVVRKLLKEERQKERAKVIREYDKKWNELCGKKINKAFDEGRKKTDSEWQEKIKKLKIPDNTAYSHDYCDAYKNHAMGWCDEEIYQNKADQKFNQVLEDLLK